MISYPRVFKCIIDELLQLHHAWFAHSFAHMLTFFNKEFAVWDSTMLLKHLSNIPSPSRKPGMVWKHAASTENICNSPSSKWSYYGLLNLRLHLFWNMPHTHRMCFKVCSYPDSHRFIYSLRPHPCICIYIYMCVCVCVYLFSFVYTHLTYDDYDVFWYSVLCIPLNLQNYFFQHQGLCFALDGSGS